MRESKSEVSIYRYGKEGISIIPFVQGNASQSQWVLFLEFSRQIISAERKGTIAPQGEGNSSPNKTIIWRTADFRGIGGTRRVMRSDESSNADETCRYLCEAEEEIQGYDRQ